MLPVVRLNDAGNLIWGRQLRPAVLLEASPTTVPILMVVKREGFQRFNAVASSPAEGSDSAGEAKMGFLKKYPALVTGFFMMWYFLNVVFNIINKKIYNYFPYPYFVSVIHLFVGVIYCLLSWTVGLPKRAYVIGWQTILFVPGGCPEIQNIFSPKISASIPSLGLENHSQKLDSIEDYGGAFQAYLGSGATALKYTSESSRKRSREKAYDADRVSPIEHGHVLLIPHVLDCMPQKIDTNSLLLALCLAREASDPFFRVGYNSLGAFATINHLHFQVSSRILRRMPER